MIENHRRIVNSCRSEPVVANLFCTLKLISTSQLLHINDFMTFPFVTSYFGRVTLEIMIKHVA